jgi:hypothetical protein
VLRTVRGRRVWTLGERSRLAAVISSQREGRGQPMFAPPSEAGRDRAPRLRVQHALRPPGKRAERGCFVSVTLPATPPPEYRGLLSKKAW